MQIILMYLFPELERLSSHDEFFNEKKIAVEFCFRKFKCFDTSTKCSGMVILQIKL